MNKILKSTVGAVGICLASQASALNILVTNDDGYSAPGIQAVYSTLMAYGHDVYLVAPKENNSGAGASINTEMGEHVEYVNYAPNQWYVDGTPRDTVTAALDVIVKDQEFDLVVSGANFGPNLGPFGVSSGTINAAVAAAQRGIPAIAVSVGLNSSELNAEPYPFPSTFAAMDDAALLTAQVINQLEANDYEGKLLPNGMALNINFPAEETSDISGIAYTNVGDFNPIEFGFVGGGSDTLVIVPKLPELTGDEDQNDEGVKHRLDYATISPIASDYSANPAGTVVIGEQLEGMVDGAGNQNLWRLIVKMFDF